MRRPLALIIVAACGGPTQSQLAETPSATTRARPAEAPPASWSDKDRERLIQSAEDQDLTMRARNEARQPASKPAAANPQNASAPKKKGPAEQATLPPKKTGPAEQATLPAK